MSILWPPDRFHWTSASYVACPYKKSSQVKRWGRLRDVSRSLMMIHIKYSLAEPKDKLNVQDVEIRDQYKVPESLYAEDYKKKDAVHGDGCCLRRKWF